jgi:serine/threonine-protein kinase
MSQVNRVEVSAADSSLEDCVERFEQAWESGQRPDIAAYLPLGDLRTAVLVELVHVDLERRLKAGEAARVERYLGSYPQLADDSTVLLDLLAAEYGLRRRREPSLTTAEYIRRFPSLGAQISSRLEAGPADGVGLPTTRNTSPAGPPTSVEERPASAPQARGAAGSRYRPLRFHARGGLGEVHVARDGELGREVALKRIQARHAHHDEARRRFLREAEVTARLEHPGVVPVYGLVHDADGQPCYAMRFIQGETLTEAIDRFHHADQAQRDPGERRVALRELLGRFVAACNTIAYAHSRGVLHRDLKPGNIMLGPFGETLVVDWGLAKVFGGTEAAPASGEDEPGRDAIDPETRLGQAIGTPAYMSPEQAAGRWNVVGPASDVYGLGATLYALLTGQAPFRGAARDVLPRVERGDFPPPRQQNRAVPRALEAICLKAQALRPEDRYASATALKDDLEKWLADEPVSAYREPLLARTGRWVRRHKTLVTSVGVSALLALVVAGDAWRRARRIEADRLAQAKSQIEAALTRATAFRDQARTVPFADRPRWKDALKLWKLANEAANQAKDLVLAGPIDEPARQELEERITELQQEAWQAEKDRVVVQDIELIRLQQAQVEGIDFNRALAVREYARTFADYGIDVKTLEPAETAVRIRRCEIGTDLIAALDEWLIDEWDEATKQRLFQVFKALDPDPAAFRNQVRDAVVRNDIAALRRVAVAREVQDLPPTALEILGERLDKWRAWDVAVAMLRTAQRRYPDDFWINMRLAHCLCLLPSHEDEGVAFYRAALALRPQSPGVHNNLGMALLHQGKRAEAIDAFNDALRLKPDFALAHSNLGRALGEQGKLPEAIAACEKAIRYKADYAPTYFYLGRALHQQGKLEEALAAYRKFAGLDTSFADVHYHIGVALYQQGMLDEAVSAYRQALQVNPNYVEAHCALGVALREQGKLAEAVEACRKGVQLRPDFAAGCCNLGYALLDQGNYAEAVVYLKRGHDLGSQKPGWYFPSEQWLRRAERLLAIEQKLPAILKGEGKPADAQGRIELAQVCRAKRFHRAAVRFYAEAFADQPNFADDWREGHRCHAAGSAALAAAGQGEDATSLSAAERAALRRQALDWLRADLTLRTRVIQGSAPDSFRMRQALRRWQTDAGLVSVRDGALAKVPPPEREAWKNLWADIETALAPPTKP